MPVRYRRGTTGPATELSLTHRGLADAVRADHAKGWSDCLDRLPAWLAAAYRQGDDGSWVPR